MQYALEIRLLFFNHNTSATELRQSKYVFFYSIHNGEVDPFVAVLALFLCLFSTNPETIPGI